MGLGITVRIIHVQIWVKATIQFFTCCKIIWKKNLIVLEGEKNTLLYSMHLQLHLPTRERKIEKSDIVYL